MVPKLANQTQQHLLSLYLNRAIWNFGSVLFWGDILAVPRGSFWSVLGVHRVLRTEPRPLAHKANTSALWALWLAYELYTSAVTYSFFCENIKTANIQCFKYLEDFQSLKITLKKIYGYKGSSNSIYDIIAIQLICYRNIWMVFLNCEFFCCIPTN